MLHVSVVGQAVRVEPVFLGLCAQAVERVVQVELVFPVLYVPVVGQAVRVSRCSALCLGRGWFRLPSVFPVLCVQAVGQVSRWV